MRKGFLFTPAPSRSVDRKWSPNYAEERRVFPSASRPPEQSWSGDLNRLVKSLQSPSLGTSRRAAIRLRSRRNLAKAGRRIAARVSRDYAQIRMLREDRKAAIYTSTVLVEDLGFLDRGSLTDRWVRLDGLRKGVTGIVSGLALLLIVSSAS